MKWEIRVPISPNEIFFRRVEYLYRSLRACGGITGEARLVVSVGEDIEPFDLAASQSWSDERVIWRWVDREAFRRESYVATDFDRFKVRTDADIVLFADADVIFVSGIDDLLENLFAAPTIAGVMAHVHPPPMPSGRWDQLFTDAKIQPARDLHQYCGWRAMDPDPARRFGPVYYNFGAVFVPEKWVALLAHCYPASIVAAENAGAGVFKAQVALTMALYRLGLRRITLEPRYNFANYTSFEEQNPEDLRDIRILHYLNREIVNKDSDFASIEAFAALISRDDLTGANEILRATLKRLSDDSAA